MARTNHWRSDEERVITVTPVGRGLLIPSMGVIAAGAIAEISSMHVHFLHMYRAWLLLVLAGPCAVVLLTRTWRWRSRKVHLSTQRVIVEGGVIHHQRNAVELADVTAIRVDQRIRERFLKRGVVILETRSGSLSLGLVRHPDALGRLIEYQRTSNSPSGVALNTVFDFDSPQNHDFDMNPRRHRGQAT
jgi:membrane protein YdbS with pleckstrin-like domain